MLSCGELDTYATNKPTLFEMSDSMPGARVLDENWAIRAHWLSQFRKDASKAGHSLEVCAGGAKPTDCWSGFRRKPD